MGSLQPSFLYVKKERKFDHLAYPCITLDVSKGSSHVQGFWDAFHPVSTAVKIQHTVEGFLQIQTIYDSIVVQTNNKPLIVLEYTGIYHHTLVSFLEQHHYDYHLVSPLKSAKMRQKNIRSAKTDKRDCANLANMFYTNELGFYYKHEPLYQNLRILNREYSSNRLHLQKYETFLVELVDIIYPNLKSVFSNLLAKSTLAFLSSFPHPDMVSDLSFEPLVQLFVSHSSHSPSFSVRKSKQIIAYVTTIQTGCPIHSFFVTSLQNLLHQLVQLLSIQADVESNMIVLAKQTPYFTYIRSIPGLGDNLTARFIAELGDISRFRRSSQINAYIGIDPIILQSGKLSGEHLSMSKKGSKRLRSIVYLMVCSMIRKKVADNSIRAYYYKKKSQLNVPPKVAIFASVNKLMRIIYSLCKSRVVYHHNSSIS